MPLLVRVLAVVIVAISWIAPAIAADSHAAPSARPAASALAPASSSALPAASSAAPAASSATPASSVDTPPPVEPPASVSPPPPVPAIVPTPAASPADAPSPRPSSTPAAASSAHAAPATADNWVRIHDKKIVELRVPRAGATAAQRAKAATHALETAVEEPEQPEVRVEESGDVAVIFVGKTPVLQLSPEDAEAAGDSSLSVHAASVAARVRGAVESERKRKEAASAVFSISLLVFSGLVALILFRKVGELAERLRTWMLQNPDRTPMLKVAGIDLFSPRAFKGGLALAIGAGRVLVQIGVTYAWILIALSLFETTRAYTTQLTNAVVGPLSGLAQRLASSVPLIIVAAVSLFALYVVLRFIGLFFQSVARGDTPVGWLPYDLAIPTGVLVRVGVVILAFVVGIPVVTGSSEGSLARAGIIALAAVGIAATPLLATAAVGAMLVYGRRMRIGDVADIGGRSGRIIGVDLLEVRLEDEHGFEIRVPHLLSLVHPTRVVGPSPVARVLVTIGAHADQPAVRQLLEETAAQIGREAKIELVAFDADGARYAVSVRTTKKDARAELLAALADVLAREKVPLGTLKGSERQR